MTTTIHLEDDELEYLRDTIRNDFQCFYDDPVGWLGFGSDRDQPNTPEWRMEVTRAEVQRLQSICTKLGLDLTELALEEANEFERIRMFNLMHEGEILNV